MRCMRDGQITDIIQSNNRQNLMTLKFCTKLDDRESI